MKILLMTLLMTATVAAQAQVPDSSAEFTLPDTNAVGMDTTRAGLWDDTAEERPEPVRTAPAPTRSTAGDTPTPARYSDSSTKTGKDVKLSKGKEFSIDRITDPDGRKHWKRMSKKARRQAPDVPPGTVPPR
jgi:hypothetical protein